MKRFLSTISLATVVATVFYDPLIRLYHYLESSNFEDIDLDEQGHV